MASEAEHERAVRDLLDHREAVRGSLSDANAGLAAAALAAKRDGVPHNVVCDWFDLSRDGLTKFIRRNHDG